MERSRTPQIVWMAIAVLVALAWLRVVSVPAPQGGHAPYSWTSAVDEVRQDVSATTAQVQRFRAAQQARYVQMWQGMHELDERLAAR